jgi:hypothetical protein
MTARGARSRAGHEKPWDVGHGVFLAISTTLRGATRSLVDEARGVTPKA